MVMVVPGVPDVGERLLILGPVAATASRDKDHAMTMIVTSLLSIRITIALLVLDL
jgi:hypothetical protein